MMKTVILAGLISTVVAGSALAQNYIEYPAPIPYQAVQHSFLSRHALVIPPYPEPFPVRIYTTPPQQPYYNVPPYAVVAPY